MAYVTQPFF